MKYAFYPGCVARGACPELYSATLEVCEILGIELDEQALEGAACTGAGVLQEKTLLLADTLNARTFALAEKSGLPLMTICSTCQGVMSQANQRLTEDPEYLAKVNETLADEGLEYKGTIDPKHLLWIIAEDLGIDFLESKIVRKLEGFKFAPFYGCYIVRPSKALKLDENPNRKQALEQVIETVGAEVVEFPGSTLCCGFPILTINPKNSQTMVANHTIDAKDRGADAMVTPCPLCHLNLDGYQPNAAALAKRDIDLPIIHLPQLVGLALGIAPEKMRLNKHLVSTKKLLSELAVAP